MWFLKTCLDLFQSHSSLLLFLSLNFLKKDFIYFGRTWSSLLTQAFSDCREWRQLLIASQGLWLQWLLLSQDSGSGAAGLSEFQGTGLVASGMWELRSGIRPVSPALSGGFLTAGPPGKSVCFPAFKASLFLFNMFPGFHPTFLSVTRFSSLLFLLHWSFPLSTYTSSNLP